MNKTLLILLLSFSVFPSFGQQDSLLKNFKYRINYYRAIIFDIGAGTQFNKSEFTTGINKNNSSAGNFGAYYYSVKSTENRLLTTNAQLNSYFSASKSSTRSTDNSSSNFGGYPRITVLNKWFSKNKFTELGADISSGIGASKYEFVNNAGVTKNSNGEYAIAITTGIGKGRLENITDMQNALRLSQALLSAERLSRPLSATEMDELGHAITAANNTRIVDTRKRIQFTLETVDNYLQQKGLINKTDIKYFSNLNDILFFAFNAPRFSGTEKYIRLTPGLTGYGTNQTQNNNLSKYERRYSTKSLVLSAGINNYTPQNLVHQNNYGASFRLCYNSLDFSDRYFTSGIITSNSKGNSILKQAAVNLFYEHAIYPNTRTGINFNLQTQGGYQYLEKEANFFGAVNFTATLNYFISYRTRLTANLGAAYQKNVYTIQQSLNLFPDNLQLYANAGVNISL